MISSVSGQFEQDDLELICSKKQRNTYLLKKKNIKSYLQSANETYKFLFLLLAKYYETGGYQLEPPLGQSEIPTGKMILFFLDEPMNTGLSRDAISTRDFVGKIFMIYGRTTLKAQ